MAITREERNRRSREYMKRFRATHPDVEQARRIRDAIRRLERAGYRIEAPTTSADDVQEVK